MPILMASPCSPLDLFLEGINFMDPIALDGGEGGYKKEGNSYRVAMAPPYSFRHSEGLSTEVVNPEAEH